MGLEKLYKTEGWTANIKQPELIVSLNRLLHQYLNALLNNDYANTNYFPTYYSLLKR